MPPKRRKFESTFPAARIKKIMQLDDEVGRVASSVPVVISRAVEIFLQALLTRGADYAETRSAKTLTVGHLKHCIEQEKQWDFLRELTSKISAVTAQEDSEEATAPKRGRKRKASPPASASAASTSSSSSRPSRKKRGKAATKSGTATPDANEGVSGSGHEDRGGAGPSVSGQTVAGRGAFSQYFNQPSTSSGASGSAASASSSQSHNSKHPHQDPSSTSSSPHPPPSLLPSSSSSLHPPPTLTPDPDSTAALTAMTAGLHRQLERDEGGDDPDDNEDYDA